MTFEMKHVNCKFMAWLNKHSEIFSWETPQSPIKRVEIKEGWPDRWEVQVIDMWGENNFMKNGIITVEKLYTIDYNGYLFVG